MPIPVYGDPRDPQLEITDYTSIDSAAILADISVRQIHRLINTDQIDTIKHGSSVLVNKFSVFGWLLAKRYVDQQPYSPDDVPPVPYTEEEAGERLITRVGHWPELSKAQRHIMDLLTNQIDGSMPWMPMFRLLWDFEALQYFNYHDDSDMEMAWLLGPMIAKFFDATGKLRREFYPSKA